MFDKTHTVNVMPLIDGVKQLLALMNFGPIPEEAKAIAFFPDGDAQFLAGYSSIGGDVPVVHVVPVYENIKITLQ